MSSKSITPIALVLFIAAAVVLGAVLLGGRLLNGDNSLLRNVEVRDNLITPNADGVTDATPIRYQLSRNAVVSIYLENTAGDRFYFRQEKPRGAGEYEVLFSGVVDGYRLPSDEVEGEILSRLLSDGEYTWTVEATDFDGVTEIRQGSITIAESDPQLPEMRNFTLDRNIFTPNRDGIDDRVLMQYYLPKEVASVRVFVQLPDGRELPISEKPRDVVPNMPGRHYYDYEGGVDSGETPPPDGTYTIVAEAQDHEGQRMRVTSELTILYGGVPRADIMSPPTGDTVEWSATAVALCDTITFTMTIQNYG
ncbi:MAG TPA: hypothetical protein PKJ56_03205, partial [Promineifilum sp.]|nr:hypothetical protein [Promineifilum sp.]